MTVGEGPCVDALARGAAVLIGELANAAFSRLRARAFVEGQPLDELAADVVSRLVRFYPEREAQ
ncbi:MAG: hypothetical protein M3Z25_20825 [Actinomycetota bacterium]|nr:hypothetical protein [Actinomycetota bacterium]